MIPVKPQPEPANFNSRVRIPGQNFLTKYPNPSKENWDKKGRKIYRNSRNQVYKQYKKICAYSAEWIPSKNKTIDYFIPISIDKTKAFEWDNFR
jgi:hypothetical protein